LDLLDPAVVKIISDYSDEILKIIDDNEGLTRSDLQAVVEALVIKILRQGIELS
jgi:hypothetical protein